MKKPFIGIPLAYCNRASSKEGRFDHFSDFPYYALRVFEANAVYLSGGTPLYLPYLWEEVDHYLDLCQGFIFPGGTGDFKPIFPTSLTQRAYHLTTEACADSVRTNFELSLLSRALTKDIPVLGICRGAQLINLVQDGTLGLVPDLQSPTKTSLTHFLPNPQEPAHPISITPNSILSQCDGWDESPMVNSVHKEAIALLGQNLIATAHASDGIIEAIESITHRFVLGVQWHPEFFQSPFDSKIFSLFIEAATQGSS